MGGERVVMIEEDGLCRLRWITKLISGMDGHVLHNRVLQRPIQRLYPLEMMEKCGTDDTTTKSNEIFEEEAHEMHSRPHRRETRNRIAAYAALDTDS